MTSILDKLSQRPAPVAVAPGFTPTAEQLAIVDFAVQQTANLQAEALAGAAKTSTMVLLANHPAMQVIPTLCLAFNKKIAETMKEKLPPNCQAMTLNSLGHRAWGGYLNKRLRLDDKKNAGIIKDLINAERRQDTKDYLWEQFSDIARYFAHGKSQGWVPDSCPRPNRRILDDETFFAALDEEQPKLIEGILIKAMLLSIDAAFAGTIDFDDQIFMSTCFGGRFPSFPLVMIDEAQDLSELQHRMLEILVGTGRLMAFGDANQAIYAFRGAYNDSMSRMRERFRMSTLTLSTSFRCPRAVVNEAHWRAPNMTAPDWAAEGSVVSWADWSVDQLPQDAVIICRNNAPLFSLAVKLLIEGRFPQIVGNDIGKSLLKALDKLGPRETSRDDALSLLEDYKLRRLSRAREHAKGQIEDFCFCLEIFLRQGDTIGGAYAYADHLMNSVGPVKLMTGHKSKGLEFDNVYILDRHLLRLDGEGAKNQDRNLLYVMQTRSKLNLTYIESERLVMSELVTKD